MYYHFVKQKTLKRIFSVIRPKKSPILKKFMGIPKIELETNINHRMSKKWDFLQLFGHTSLKQVIVRKCLFI